MRFSFPTLARWSAATAAVMLLSSWAYVTLTGPRGYEALRERHQEIRQLQERNAELQKEIERKKERVRRLGDNETEQELEIRRRWKLQRPNEMQFILPEAKP